MNTSAPNKQCSWLSHNVPRPYCLFSRSSTSSLTKHALMPQYKLVFYYWRPWKGNCLVSTPRKVWNLAGYWAHGKRYFSKTYSSLLVFGSWESVISEAKEHYNCTKTVSLLLALPRQISFHICVWFMKFLRRNPIVYILANWLRISWLPISSDKLKSNVLKLNKTSSVCDGG